MQDSINYAGRSHLIGPHLSFVLSLYMGPKTLKNAQRQPTGLQSIRFAIKLPGAIHGYFFSDRSNIVRGCLSPPRPINRTARGHPARCYIHTKMTRASCTCTIHVGRANWCLWKRGSGFPLLSSTRHSVRDNSDIGARSTCQVCSLHHRAPGILQQPVFILYTFRWRSKRTGTSSAPNKKNDAS